MSVYKRAYTFYIPVSHYGATAYTFCGHVVHANKFVYRPTLSACTHIDIFGKISYHNFCSLSLSKVTLKIPFSPHASSTGFCLYTRSKHLAYFSVYLTLFMRRRVLNECAIILRAYARTHTRGEDILLKYALPPPPYPNRTYRNRRNIFKRVYKSRIIKMLCT